MTVLWWSHHLWPALLAVAGTGLLASRSVRSLSGWRWGVAGLWILALEGFWRFLARTLPLWLHGTLGLNLSEMGFWLTAWDLFGVFLGAVGGICLAVGLWTGVRSR